MWKPVLVLVTVAVTTSCGKDAAKSAANTIARKAAESAANSLENGEDSIAPIASIVGDGLEALGGLEDVIGEAAGAAVFESIRFLQGLSGGSRSEEHVAQADAILNVRHVCRTSLCKYNAVRIFPRPIDENWSVLSFGGRTHKIRFAIAGGDDAASSYSIAFDHEPDGPYTLRPVFEECRNRGEAPKRITALDFLMAVGDRVGTLYERQEYALFEDEVRIVAAYMSRVLND